MGKVIGCCVGRGVAGAARLSEEMMTDFLVVKRRRDDDGGEEGPFMPADQS